MRTLVVLSMLMICSTRLEAASDAGASGAGPQTMLQASPVPPPPGQTRADCVRPTYATDMTVCGDPALKAKDEEMAMLLARAGPRANSGEAPLLEPQDVWFRRRSLCAFKEDQRPCVEAAYEERLAVLGSLVGAAGPTAPPFTCRASWRKGAVAARRIKDGVVVASIGGAPIGIGVVPIKGSGWRPYATVEARGRHALRISTADGPSLLCSGKAGAN